MPILRNAANSRAVARFSARRLNPADMFWVNKKLSAPDRIATGQPVNSASAALSVAEANRQVRVIRALVMERPRGISSPSLTPARFQILNHEIIAETPAAPRALTPWLPVSRAQEKSPGVSTGAFGRSTLKFNHRGAVRRRARRRAAGAAAEPRSAAEGSAPVAAA